ncbi:hypothetical protein EYC84_008343 [Monilinia fructicola]|uniref:Uncharacterized protein n=1 Tax=Monilinia fructicola TaxID=38448 RepID=A0A5M9JGL6_MONFR|nr:hypothetical protein EYC84_008343 [Monilinia fructicola]
MKWCVWLLLDFIPLPLPLPYPYCYVYVFYTSNNPIIHQSQSPSLLRKYPSRDISFISHAVFNMAPVTPPSIPFPNQIQNYKNPTIHEFQLLKIHVFCFWLCNQTNPGGLLPHAHPLPLDPPSIIQPGMKLYPNVPDIE